MVARLPKVERRIYQLSIKKGLTQKEIASRLGCTQAAVAYRLTRIWDRLQFIQEHLFLLRATKARMRRDLRGLFTPLQLNALWKMVEYGGCQSEVASQMGTLQGWVRYTLVSAAHKLKNREGQLGEWGRLFLGFALHPNILFSVSTPQQLARREKRVNSTRTASSP